MKQVQRILFPLDLVSEYQTIIPWVKDMAQKFDAAILLLYVARPVSMFPSFYVNIDMGGFEAEVQVAAREQIAALAKDLFKDFPKVKTRVEFGQPAEKILEVAKKEEIDMIIMGTHGRKGLNRAIFGSVAFKVVQSARCPVITIHP